jgi:hypothetical protein
MNKKFEGQQNDEEVLYVFRRHPIVMRKGIILAGIFMVLGELPSLYWAELNVLIIGFLIGLGLGMLAFFYHWIGWYFSVCIVTNVRLRQISQKGLFKRSVVDIYLKRIQNVNFSISGFTETVLGFGTIIVQTIVGDMVLDTLPHPEKRHAELLEALQDNGIVVNNSGDLDEV